MLCSKHGLSFRIICQTTSSTVFGEIQYNFNIISSGALLNLSATWKAKEEFIVWIIIPLNL